MWRRALQLSGRIVRGKNAAAWWMRQLDDHQANEASDARQQGLLETAGASLLEQSVSRRAVAAGRPKPQREQQPAARPPEPVQRTPGACSRKLARIPRGPVCALLNSKRRGDAGAHCARIDTVGLRRRTPVIPLTRREVTASSSRDAAGQQLRNHSRRHSSQSASRTYTGARAARNEDRRQRRHVQHGRGRARRLAAQVW